MSVYIRGMKMPGVCYECYFCTYGFCAHLERYVTATQERDADCPLVELPPHGRLIDADALAAQCDDPYWCVWLSDIDAAPTIIPAEEVQDNG